MTPPTPPDLPVTAPGEQGVDARGVAAFLDVLRADARIDPHSIMLLRHGAVVAEGWWAPYTRDRVHMLYSLSKTFTATALGFAVAEGLVSLDDAVVDHFPQFQADIVGRSREIRVRHVAAMATGHHSDMLHTAERTDPAEPVRGFLLHQPESAPGSVFAYNQPATYAVACIVQRAAGTTLVEYLRPRLFDPLGIGPVSWQQYLPGSDLGFSGLHARTDAVAKLGQLYLRDGVWQGRRILPVGWVEQVRTRHVGTPQNQAVDWQQGYGFQVWMSRHGYRGDGAFGQFCLILPEQDAVLAMTSETTDMQAVLDAVWEHLLPAFDTKPPSGEGGEGREGGTSRAGGTGREGGDSRAGGDGRDGTGGASPDDEAALAHRLSTLALPPLTGRAAPEDATGWVGRFTSTSASAFGLAGTLDISCDAGGWRVVLPDPGGDIAVPVGAEGWRVSEHAGGTGEPSEQPTPVAASGGWTDGDTLRLDVLFLDTPHRLELTVGRVDRRFTAHWVNEPLVRSLSELRAPRSLSEPRAPRPLSGLRAPRSLSELRAPRPTA